jgi:hypothetical protein
VSVPLLKTIAKNCLEDLLSNPTPPPSTSMCYKNAVFSENMLTGFKKMS